MNHTIANTHSIISFRQIRLSTKIIHILEIFSMKFIARLFKSHCCSFYGSQVWRIDLPDYKRICISWNKSVRNILRLQFTTHTWILGPLLGQPHIHCQLQQRTLHFLCSIQNNNNTLVSACWKYASYNAISPLGYNIA